MTSTGTLWPGYAYVASPYTDPDPAVMASRYASALHFTASALSRGLFVYSPIVHCHEAAVKFTLPRHAEFWWSYNKAMLASAGAFIRLEIPGWAESKGLRQEEEYVTHALDIPQYRTRIQPDLDWKLFSSDQREVAVPDRRL